MPHGKNPFDSSLFHQQQNTEEDVPTFPSRYSRGIPFGIDSDSPIQKPWGSHQISQTKIPSPPRSIRDPVAPLKP